MLDNPLLCSVCNNWCCSSPCPTPDKRQTTRCCAPYPTLDNPLLCSVCNVRQPVVVNHLQRQTTWCCASCPSSDGYLHYYEERKNNALKTNKKQSAQRLKSEINYAQYLTSKTTCAQHLTSKTTCAQHPVLKTTCPQHSTSKNTCEHA